MTAPSASPASASRSKTNWCSRVESHRYDPVRVLQWRNAALDFRSLDALLDSLDAPPPERGLARARPASDAVALRHLSADDEVRGARHARAAAVRRLWDVCQLPDFRKLSADEHVKLVRTIFLFLMSDDGVLPDDWLARQIARLDVDRRRCRHPVGAAGADPHLHLCRASPGLDARRRALAGRDARGGRPAVGCAA